MTVIAKLFVSRTTDFNTGSFVELSCICENDLMAAYATKDEDKLFTRYSPWGEIRLNQRAGWAVFTHEGEAHIPAPGGPKAFYAVMQPADQVEDASVRFKRAAAFVKINCYSKSQFAQDGSRVELREIYSWQKFVDDLVPNQNGYRDWHRTRAAVIDKLSWKMQVDNPPAEAQFVPGSDYWLAFYDAGEFDMSAALAAAHGGV